VLVSTVPVAPVTTYVPFRYAALVQSVFGYRATLQVLPALVTVGGVDDGGVVLAAPPPPPPPHPVTPAAVNAMPIKIRLTMRLSLDYWYLTGRQERSLAYAVAGPRADPSM
jgi:hypothetical protein